MSVVDGWLHRLRVLLRPDAFERDLAEEMRFHEELDATQQRDAARARRRFGNRTYYREETRDVTWLRFVDVVRQDVGYAWRSVRRAPGFTAMVIVTLALGLGVNAATFSVLDRLFLRPPAGVVDAERVRRLWFENSAERSYRGESFTTPASSWIEWHDVALASGAPERFALFLTDFALTRRDGDTRSRVRAAYATASFFPVLGVRAGMGRTYTALEDSIGQGSAVVVLTHRFWRDALGSDSTIIGRTLNIERRDYAVVGVLEPGFEGLDLQAVDVFIPFASVPARSDRWWMNGNVNGFQGFYRAESAARDVVFEERATAAHRQTQRIMWPQNPDTLARVLTGPLYGGGPGKDGQDMLISKRLGIVAGIILVIACANVINLLLARAERRKREIAVRLALGISRVRLVRLLTAETVLLALLAGGVALLTAAWGGGLLRSLISPEVTWYESVMHWRVVVFAFAVSLGAGLVAGIIPALQASNPGLTNALKEGTRAASAPRSRLRSALVAIQAALSVVLLVGAALFVRSLQNVQGLDIGYDHDRLVFGYVTFEPGQSPPPVVGNATMNELRQQLLMRPGVEGVGRTSMVPMQGIGFSLFWWDADSSWSIAKNGPSSLSVDSAFFRTVGLKFLHGEPLQSHSGAPRQVVINEQMARRLWPGRDLSHAIGRCIRFEQRDAPCYTVSGVVENSRQSYVIEKEPMPQYYLPLENLPTGNTYRGILAVRTRGPAGDVVRQELGTALGRAFPGAEVRVESMSDSLEPDYRPWRLGATLFAAFGLLALIVAMIGIYSTVSYGVTQRVHEFGVRMALGARLGDVLVQVVGEGLRVVAVGVVAGIALALAAGKLVSALLYGIAPSDPIVMGTVAVALLAVAAAAAVIPAWRASKVDPVVALRAD